MDARDAASDTRGIGRYTRAILRRLVKREDLDLTLLVRGPFAARHRAQLRVTLGSDRFGVASRAPGTDVVWHPANGTFFRGRPSVATIHDVVPFRFPHPDPARRAHQQGPFWRSVREAKRIIAVSQFDREELADVFGITCERIEVIYHGVDPEFSPGEPGEELPRDLRRPYLLFVGDPAAEPRKNFELLHQAYRSAFPSIDAPALVVVGPSDPRRAGVRYAGAAAGDAAGAGDARLLALYRGALALCVPSYYETFGMPLIEAMACGTPTIAARASCLPEIGGDAARYAPPDDAAAWREALREIVEDDALRQRLRVAGLQRAMHFTWEESARRHAEVFFSA